MMNLVRVFSRKYTNFADLRKSQVPVISVPKYMEAEVKKHERRHDREIERVYEEREMKGDRRRPIIVSKGGDRKFTHYLGQRYRLDRRNREPNVPLFSAGWMHGLKHQNEEITFRAYEERNPLPALTDDVVRFDQLPLDKNVIGTLNQQGFTEPTPIQVKAIGEILTSKNVIISSEAGGGKTLAYGIPLIHSVLRFKKSAKRQSSDPIAMVIVPSRELAEQIGKVLTNLAAVVGVGVATMIGGAPKHLPHTGYDIIVTTAGLIQHHRRENLYTFKGLKHLVLDEADTLLDDSFSTEILDVMSQLHITGSPDQTCQLVMASATLPSRIEDVLGEHVDPKSIYRITTPMLHRIPSHITHRFMRINKMDRDAALLKLLNGDLMAGRPVMVFANRTPMSNWIYGFLNENDFPCVRLNKTLGPCERLNQFDKFQDGDYDIISCTDLASRGLGTKRVRHVINYDCPHFVADYLHRAGRCGRDSNMPGQVTTFVSFKPDVALVQSLERSLRLNKRVPDVDGNIKRCWRDHAERHRKPRG